MTKMAHPNLSFERNLNNRRASPVYRQDQLHGYGDQVANLYSGMELKNSSHLLRFHCFICSFFCKASGSFQLRSLV